VNEQANPFFSESPLPLHYPQFDKIKDSDFAPAFDRGMADQKKEIDAIANNKAKPTFDNTIIAMEKSGRILTRAATVFGNLVGADTNDTRDKLDADYSPKFAAHRTRSTSIRSCSPASRRSTTPAPRSASTPKACVWSRSTTPTSSVPAPTSRPNSRFA
jgi:peptidyl-dipeptidase Dcp